MQNRILGRTGVSVSPLCLGTRMFGPWGNSAPRDVRGYDQSKSGMSAVPCDCAIAIAPGNWGMPGGWPVV
jgi:hypothetical protein